MRAYRVMRAVSLLFALLVIGSAAAQTQTSVTLELGTGGATISLIANADGSYGIGGWSGVSSVRFGMDGTPTAAITDDGKTYNLVLGDDGKWSAVLEAPGPQTIQLGTSNSSVTLAQAEDGSYFIAGVNGVTALEEDAEGNRIAVALNGNRYRLTLDNGVWMATFLAPEPQTVQLGDGRSVQIATAEDGTYSIGGATVEPGGTWTAPDGSVYTLALDQSGMWTATSKAAQDPVTQTVVVKLGDSGESVTLTKAADGSYRLGSTVIQQGSPATVKDTGGNSYSLTVNAAGELVVELLTPAPVAPVTVALGSSGEVLSITMDEQGNFFIGDTQIKIPGTYTSSQGNEYRLERDSSGNLTATYLPLTLQVAGTGLTLQKKEVGGGYQAGNVDVPALPADGASIDLTVDGRMYRIWADGMALRGELYDLAPNADTAYYSGQLAAVGIEASGTRLRVADENSAGFFADFPISDLLGSSGRSSQAGETFAAEAKGQLEKAREQAVALIGLHSSGVLSGDETRNRLRSLWEDATIQVDNVLGAGHLPSNAPREDIFESRIDDVISALSSLDAFQKATASGGGGVFDAAGFDANRAAEVFGASQGETVIAFGATGTTRYGAVSHLERTNAVSDLEHVLESGTVLTDVNNGALLKGVTVNYDGNNVTVTPQWGSAVAGGRIAVGDVGDGPFVGDTANLADLQISRGSNLRYDEEVALSVNGNDLVATVTRGRAGGGISATIAAFAPTVQQTTVSNFRVLGAQGAFAYSTDQETFLRRDLRTSGSASYTGGTRAVGSDGTLFEGEIDILVRFSASTVNGLVKNLASVENGIPWQHLSENAETINLPEATLLRDGTWNTTPGEKVLVTYQGLGLRPHTATFDGTFRGSLVGRNPAGDEVVGTWTVDGSAGETLLAGGFGASLGTGGSGTGSPTDPAGAGTSVLPAWTEISSGSLRLTTHQYGWNRAGSPPIWVYGVKRDGGQVLERTYEIGLSSLQASPPKEVSVDGTNADGLSTHVAQVRARISELRSDLESLIGIDDGSPGLKSAQEARWQQLQDSLETSLFDQVPDALAGSYDAADALGLIDRALKGLTSPAELQDALDPRGDGIFTVSGAPAATRAAADIFEQPESQIQLLAGSTTNYTTFGAWKLQTSERAADDSWTTQSGKKDGPNSYAYSSLRTATIAGITSPFYPPGYRATYTGDTIAVQGETFYTGKIELSVVWDRNQVQGQLAATISQIENAANGELLSYTYVDGGSLSAALVGELVLFNITVSPESGTNNLVFSADSATVGSMARVRAEEIGAPSTELLVSQDTKINGAFVGQSENGPLGVIGRWELRTGMADIPTGAPQIGDGTRMFGGFGAELVP